MALLAEYALTPDVFDVASYSSEEVCGLYLDKLREALMNEAIVRDLRDGAWSQLCARDGAQCHRATKKLLKKLNGEGRLVRSSAAIRSEPSNANDWCREALASHILIGLNGIVTTGSTAQQFEHDQIVAAVDRLSTATWWQKRTQSVQLPRRTASYLSALTLFLRHANSLTFIDPHLDPARHGYSEFGTLLRAIGPRSPAPTIEIHRVCYRGSGANRDILKPSEIEATFQRLAPDLETNGLSAEVFVWDDFHYRFLLSNLGGVMLDNGFDISASPQASTVWSRLGRDVRDNVQREFEPAFGRHALRHRFKIS